MLILGGDGVEGCGQHYGGFSSENETSTRSHFFRISLVDHEAKGSAGRVCISLFFIILALLLCSNDGIWTGTWGVQAYGQSRNGRGEKRRIRALPTWGATDSCISLTH
jgi:hypothetical protein